MAGKPFHLCIGLPSSRQDCQCILRGNFLPHLLVFWMLEDAANDIKIISSHAELLSMPDVCEILFRGKLH